MAFESSGADYLRKLKQDLHPAPAFEESTVAPSPAASADGKQERRINPRYKCEGSAEFRTEGSDVRTWGTFTDLSLGGCYVEMKATFPVGALVDLTLDLNDVRVQVKGEVRMSYPFLGIGIAFRDISPENQLHLKQMIRSICPATSAVPPHEVETPAKHSSLPIIVNPAAALQALADYFEMHAVLSKEEFFRVLRISQGSEDFHDNWK
jgi:hypothetical protein